MTKKQKRELKKIIIALIIFLCLVIFEHTADIPAITQSRLIMFILFLIPYFIVGGSVVRKALLGIKNRQMFDESFLMTIATIGAFVTGENAEACAVMLFYQVGEFFQSYAVGRSRKSISDLMDIQPEYANLENENGSIEVIDPDDVEVGNILVIKPGEKVPVDGIVTEGFSMVNTSALTGESVPRNIEPGDQIISGCINGEGLLKIEATKAYEDSTVAKILELVENAASKKSRTENFITRFARYYTPIVVIAAVILAIIPSVITGEWSVWIYRACTFLVISCPCALVISVPLSFFGGIGAASNQGVLVKGSNYLELMADVDTIVSDKTGTLTKGEFKVNDVICAEGVSKEEVLRLAALAEAMSTHPIAASIKEAYQGTWTTDRVEDVKNVSGQGIIATIEKRPVLVGNEKLMTAHHIVFKKSDDLTATVVYVACDDQYIGTILISDAVKPEAAEAIAELKHDAVKRIVMLTGDRRETADAVAHKLGLDAVYSELLPGDKVEKVEELLTDLKGTKRKLAFIGDGINDAPVLTRADIGIAMGSMGSDAAIEAADIVIMDDNLNRLPIIIRIAKKTVRISKQNIIFALVVKIGILILGALGIANMWAAVFADVGVAVICILNAMRTMIQNRKDENKKIA